MRNYWFKAKTYGWGWYPATWQGWLILLVWVVVFVLIMWNSLSQKLSDSEATITLLPQVAVSVLLLIFICWKTGEPPRWRWGK